MQQSGSRVAQLVLREHLLECTRTTTDPDGIWKLSLKAPQIMWVTTECDCPNGTGWEAEPVRHSQGKACHRQDGKKEKDKRARRREPKGVQETRGEDIRMVGYAWAPFFIKPNPDVLLVSQKL